jgi:hypothetical protein
MRGATPLRRYMPSRRGQGKFTFIGLCLDLPLKSPNSSPTHLHSLMCHISVSIRLLYVRACVSVCLFFKVSILSAVYSMIKHAN